MVDSPNRTQEHDHETARTEAGERESQITSPDRLLRVGSMLRSLQEELHQDETDVPSREQLRRVHEAALAQVREVLSGPLEEEFEEVSFGFDEDAPSEAQLRIAQAQLVGWLEGLFQGLQAAAMGSAQQGGAPEQQSPTGKPEHRSGQYL